MLKCIQFLAYGRKLFGLVRCFLPTLVSLFWQCYYCYMRYYIGEVDEKECENSVLFYNLLEVLNFQIRSYF